MKKILFVNSSLASGGSERVMTLLANEFANRNYDVSMFLLRDGKKDVYKLSEKIKCVRFKYKYKNKLYIGVSRLLKMHNLIKKNKYDVIISFMYDINYMTAISCVGCGSKLIISERADPKNRTVSFIGRLLNNFSFLKSDKIVFQTKDVMNYFNSKIKSKSVVIPNPVNCHIGKSVFSSRKENIIAAGRLTEQKNFDMLIDAFAILKEEKKYSNFKLYIYGEGPLKNILKEKTKSLGLNKDVFFPGFDNNIEEKMKKSYLYVSSSNFEGISNSMIEAMAIGLPVICTDCPVGGASLMIKNNVNGILISVGDVKSLHRSMKKVIDDKDFAQKIGNNAIKVNDDYSINKIVDIWEKVL